uniref:RNA-dependent RNA polymerase n=1 Tax=Populus alba TaxID=43335 RepID=A0A4U5PYM1_POPAL|nr:hypothetical protein D5086_0000161290 [Populus alba]
MKWVPTWKSLPTFKQMNDLLRQNAREQGIGFPFKGSIKSCFPAVFFELSAYTFLLEFIHSRGEQWSSGILWPERTRFALDRQNISGSDLDQFEKTCGPQLPSYRDLRIPPITGRLGCTFEGGGKRRIFAIGNYINQRLLKPVHDWLMDVLRGVPMDGCLLATIHPGPFSHSLTTCWCADQVHPGMKFDSYAVLGDDVVIADSSVAKVYERALEQFGVMISYQKSLISNTGCAEFAKQFRVHALRKDLSPISARALMNFFHPYGLISIGQRYGCCRFSTLARVWGGWFSDTGYYRDQIKVREVVADQNSPSSRGL